MIETLAAEAINNEPIKLTIGKDEYLVPRPTLRTMITASKEISKLPQLDKDGKSVIASMMSYAEHSGGIAKVIATLLLGAKRNYSFLHKYRIKMLSLKIENKYTIGELYLAYSELITQVMQIQSFFAITTSLNEINLLRKTKEVVKKTKTIPYGQSAESSL